MEIKTFGSKREDYSTVISVPSVIFAVTVIGSTVIYIINP